MTNKRCHSIAFCDQMQTAVDVSPDYHNHSSWESDTHEEDSPLEQRLMLEITRLTHALWEAEERGDEWEQKNKDLQGRVKRLENALSRAEKREDVICKNAQRRIDKLLGPYSERKLELNNALRELSMQATAHAAALEEQKAIHAAALEEQKAVHAAALEEQKAIYEAAIKYFRSLHH